MGFEEVDHTADHALKVTGADLADLFISAAEGMTSLMVTDPQAVSQEIAKTIKIRAADTESLLVEWLSELAYWAEAQMLVFKTFRFQIITARHLEATAAGGKTVEFDKYIKAVTYHNLKIVKTRQGYETVIVFDV
jgi:SHS2 domain-containing protein